MDTEDFFIVGKASGLAYGPFFNRTTAKLWLASRGWSKGRYRIIRFRVTSVMAPWQA